MVAEFRKKRCRKRSRSPKPPGIRNEAQKMPGILYSMSSMTFGSPSIIAMAQSAHIKASQRHAPIIIFVFSLFCYHTIYTRILYIIWCFKVLSALNLAFLFLYYSHRFSCILLQSWPCAPRSFTSHLALVGLTQLLNLISKPSHIMSGRKMQPTKMPITRF